MARSGVAKVMAGLGSGLKSALKASLGRRSPLTTLPGAALMTGLIAVALAIAFAGSPGARDGTGVVIAAAGFRQAGAGGAARSLADTGATRGSRATPGPGAAGEETAGPSGGALAAAPPSPPDRVTAARGLADRFAAAVRFELVKALDAAGPAGAIDVCGRRAPEIAAVLAKESGWRVGRTSLKVRNPANLPDVWETRALQEFDARRAKGEDPAKLEFSEVVGDSAGGGGFRFLAALPMAEPCAACHGKTIDPAVAAHVARLYPHDQATGFAVGDVRGAITITIPLTQ